MNSLKNLRLLPADDFRAQRAYLADHVFMNVPGGGAPANDPIHQDTWDRLMHLPTDVLLRTTDYQGRQISDAKQQSRLWTTTVWDQISNNQPLYDVALDVSDEFEAAVFISAHGWYRQGTSGLRTVIELVAQAAAFAVTNDFAGYTRWQTSGKKPNYGVSLGKLSHARSDDLSQSAIGVLRRLYGDLSRSTHANPGSGNVDQWGSNGPVWVWSGFTDFWLELSDTVAASYVLARLAHPEFALPVAAETLFKSPSPRWELLGEHLLSELFVSS